MILSSPTALPVATLKSAATKTVLPAGFEMSVGTVMGLGFPHSISAAGLERTRVVESPIIKCVCELSFIVHQWKQIASMVASESGWVREFSNGKPGLVIERQVVDGRA
jgi:hypothetical protein